jgi:hypothetical protein
MFAIFQGQKGNFQYLSPCLSQLQIGNITYGPPSGWATDTHYFRIRREPVHELETVVPNQDVRTPRLDSFFYFGC